MDGPAHSHRQVGNIGHCFDVAQQFKSRDLAIARTLINTLNLLKEKMMKDHGISLNKKCPCTQKECPIKGNCVLCVQNHLVHKRHIPECIQNLLRPVVEELADKMELATSESRPDKNFWNDFDKEKFLKETKDKHK